VLPRMGIEEKRRKIIKEWMKFGRIKVWRRTIILKKGDNIYGNVYSKVFSNIYLRNTNRIYFMVYFNKNI